MKGDAAKGGLFLIDKRENPMGVARSVGQGLEEESQEQIFKSGKFFLRMLFSDLFKNDSLQPLAQPITVHTIERPYGRQTIKIVAGRKKELAGSPEKPEPALDERRIAELQEKLAIVETQLAKVTAENLRLAGTLTEQERASIAERQEVLLKLEKALRNRPGILGGESGLRKAIETLVQNLKNFEK